jgi:glycosyltransferase involved in cell wall biosynthesis
VFTNSAEVKRRVVSANLVEEARVEVAHHGVDADWWRPDGRRERFFLVAGRIMWQKNIELAIEAWTRFKPRPSDNDFSLVVAGMVDAKSRPYVDALRVRAAGRPDIQFVVGPTDSEMLDLYQRCWAVVFPPTNEDWGLVPLEAMACGKPVLATDRGGPRETVVDGMTGFLRDDRPDSFAEAMTVMAGMSPDEMTTMSARARARALEVPWSRFVERIDDHVDELATLRGLPWRRLSAAAIAESYPLLRQTKPVAELQPVPLQIQAEPELV